MPCGKADVEAVKRGATNVRRHVKNVKKFGVPVVVALNRFNHGHRGRARGGAGRVRREGVGVELCEVWEKGGEGGVAVAEAVLKLLDGRTAKFKPLYDEKRPIREKIETIAQEIYGGRWRGVSPPRRSGRSKQAASDGLGETPVCMAKTQYSFSDDPTKLGAPSGFTLPGPGYSALRGRGFRRGAGGASWTMPGCRRRPRPKRSACTRTEQSRDSSNGTQAPWELS